MFIGSGSGVSESGDGVGLTTSERRMTRLEEVLAVLISEAGTSGGGTGL